MTKLQSLRITTAIDKIVEGLNMLKNAVEAFVPAEEPAGKPESLVDKFPAEFEASKPRTRPIQLKLPLPPAAVVHAARQRLGDVGYENEVNPSRRACGQLGGFATAGVKRAPSPDRRKPGTVMVKDMSVNEKRRYWRWTKQRAVCRAAGAAPVSWAAWAGERG